MEEKGKMIYFAHTGQILTIQGTYDDLQLIVEEFSGIRKENQIILTKDSEELTHELFNYHEKLFCFDNETFQNHKPYFSENLTTPLQTLPEPQSGYHDPLDAKFKENLMGDVFTLAKNSVTQLNILKDDLNNKMRIFPSLYRCLKVAGSRKMNVVESLICDIQTSTQHLEETLQTFHSTKEKLKETKIHKKLQTESVKTLYDFAFQNTKIENYLNDCQSSCNGVKKLLNEKLTSYQPMLDLKSTPIEENIESKTFTENMQQLYSEIETKQQNLNTTLQSLQQHLKNNDYTSDFVIQIGKSVKEHWLSLNQYINIINPAWNDIILSITKQYNIISSMYTTSTKTAEDVAVLRVIKEKIRNTFSSLSHFISISETYYHSVEEIKRRNAFKRFLELQFSALNQRFKAVFDEEYEKRRQFLKSHHLPTVISMFPSLNDRFSSIQFNFDHLDRDLPPIAYNHCMKIKSDHNDNNDLIGDDDAQNEDETEELTRLMRSFTPIVNISNHDFACLDEQNVGDNDDDDYGDDNLKKEEITSEIRCHRCKTNINDENNNNINDEEAVLRIAIEESADNHHRQRMNATLKSIFNALNDYIDDSPIINNDVIIGESVGEENLEENEDLEKKIVSKIRTLQCKLNALRDETQSYQLMLKESSLSDNRSDDDKEKEKAEKKNDISMMISAESGDDVCFITKEEKQELMSYRNEAVNFAGLIFNSRTNISEQNSIFSTAFLLLTRYEEGKCVTFENFEENHCVLFEKTNQGLLRLITRYSTPYILDPSLIAQADLQGQSLFLGKYESSMEKITSRYNPFKLDEHANPRYYIVHAKILFYNRLPNLYYHDFIN